MRRTKLRALVLLVAAAAVLAPAMGNDVWQWRDPWRISPEERIEVLTENNGARAVAVTEYDNPLKAYVAIAAHRPGDTRDTIEAHEYEDMYMYPAQYYYPPAPHAFTVYDISEPKNAAVAANSHHKTWVWCDDVGDRLKVRSISTDLTDRDPPSTAFQHNNGNNSSCENRMCAVTAFGKNAQGNDNHHVCVVYGDTTVNDGYWGLYGSYSDDDGESWTRDRQVVPGRDGYALSHPSLAVDDGGGTSVYLVYAAQKTGVGADYDSIIFIPSADCGLSWNSELRVVLSTAGKDPCVAAVDDFVFACWVEQDGSRTKVVHRHSVDGGATWSPGSPAQVPFQSGNEPTLDKPNVTAVRHSDGTFRVLVVARACIEGAWWTVYAMSGRYFPLISTGFLWRTEPMLTKLLNTGNPNPLQLNPSVAAVKFANGHAGGYPHAMFVVGHPWPMQPPHEWWYHVIYRRGAYFGPPSPGPHGGVLNTGRLLAKSADGDRHFAGEMWPHVVAGPVLREPLNAIVGLGSCPALAVDGDGQRWVAFLWNDSVWVNYGADAPKLVFAGSNSARPGQSSISVYPNSAVGAVVFPVYDSAGGDESHILFAKFDSSHLVLDTIDTRADLSDSSPSLNIVYSDTLVVTWQRGTDSIVAKRLPDYGAGVWGSPPAWVDSSAVSASGYHPASLLEGTMVHSVWTSCIEDLLGPDTFVVREATYDASDSPIFAGWMPATSASGQDTMVKDGAVYAGCGVSVWQQMTSSKWVIRGRVRGDTVTLVSTDSGSYHPHAVAESSAIGPSVDEVRVHLLWCEGVTFEVDSGVVDTGEARYKCCSLDVSHAGSNATVSNSGTKLMRKPLSDSLLAVYADADGATIYAWSAAGDSWKRAVVAQNCNQPAIAQDSAGRRYVVMVNKVSQYVSAVKVRYRDSNAPSGWSSEQLVCQAGTNAFSPPSMAAVSDTDAHRAYVAFTVTCGVKRLLVAKLNGEASLHIDTIATGNGLGAPCIAVEPVSQDTDNIHVTWTDGGDVWYTMLTDVRSGTITGNWQTAVKLANTDNAAHPAIAANREHVVCAWADGLTPDVYTRKRSTDSAYDHWEDTLNLSKTSNKTSDYPTIALGDSTIIAWQENRSDTDHDILISIDFDDTLNVADNSTKSNYPHVLFQKKTSGDTTIPYVHLIWSEEPSTSYYEVRYNKLNLKQASGGGGGQSAGTPMKVQPMLYACRPNPFRNRTLISYQFAQAGNVQLKVYDAMGRVVRTLHDGQQKPGRYTATWDGTDNRGRALANGIYFYSLNAPGYRDVKKAVVMR